MDQVITEQVLFYFNTSSLKTVVNESYWRCLRPWFDNRWIKANIVEFNAEAICPVELM